MDSYVQILVVDDGPSTLQIMVSALARAGYDVLEARNGQEALDILTSPQGKNIAAVVSDLEMPLMTGAELAREITKRKLKIPILLVSGAEAEDVRAFGVNGSRPFLAKPFTIPKLLTAVADLLKT